MRRNRRLLNTRLLLVLFWALCPGFAFAATYNLPASIGSAPFSSCSFTSGTTYTCTGNVSIGNNNTVNFTSAMTLQVNGNFIMGNNSNLSNSGGFSVTVSANGNITLGNSNVSAINFTTGGNFESGNTASITGNITAGGNVQLGNNNTVTGNVSAGGDLSVGSGSTITGWCTYSSTNHTCSGSQPPVAEYRFDECTQYTGTAGQITDNIGTYPGTPAGGLQNATPGKINRYADFSNATRYARLPSGPAITTWTITTWFQKPFATTNHSSQYYVLGSVNVRGDLLYLDRNSTGGAYRWGVYDQTGGQTNGTFRFSTLTDGWHHLVLVGSGSSTYLYIDGTLRDQINRKTSGTLGYIGSSIDNVGSASGQSFGTPLDEFKVFNSALNATQISTIYNNEAAGKNWNGTTRSNPCTASLHHVRLGHTGSGVTCTGSSVTVYACDSADSGGTCTANTSGLSGNVTTSSGVSVAFTIPAGNSSTTVSVPVTTAQTVTFGTSSLSVTPSSSTTCWDGSAASCSHVYSDAGFIFSTSLNGASATIPTQTAGTSSSTYYLRAVKTSTTTKACEAALAGSNTVNFGYECNNPTTCSSSNLMSINGGTATTISRNNIGSVSSYTSVPMTFDANGNAPFTFNFSDVGLVALHASKVAGGSLLTALTGSSNAFVTKPAGFTISNIKQTAAPQLANPAAADASGNKFVKAGESFTATVTATTSGGAATPNYGNETSPEGIKLTQALVLPGGGNSGVLSNSAIAGTEFGTTGMVTTDADGVATVTNLAWNEVGIMTLTPSVGDGDYLGAGDVTGTATGNIGRFYPDHFTITTGAVTPACGTSTYFGQDGVTTAFTITAQNSGNVTTQNYTGSFAKLGLSTWSNFGFSSDAPAGSTLSASTTAPSGAWGAGTTSGLQARHVIGRPTLLPASPGITSVTISAAPTDSDGVTASSTAVSAASSLYFGRLWVGNAFGSDKIDLTVPFQTQYWNGSGFVKHVADSCTTLASNNIALGNKQGGLTAYSGPVTGGTASSGAGSIVLSKPASATAGSVDLLINLGATGSPANCSGLTGGTSAGLAYLSGRWCGSDYDRDPTARATFGIFGKKGPIYLRENY